MSDKLRKIIDFLENSFQGGLMVWFFSFLTIIATRLIIEGLMLGFPDQTLEEFLAFSLHTFLFFLLSYLIFLIYLQITVKRGFIKTASVLLWCFWVVIFPPIIDKIYFGDKKVWSFYVFDGIKGLFDKFFSFFGEDLTIGITLGTRVEVVLALIFLCIYFFYYKKNWFKTILFTLGVYILFFILGSLPSLFVLIGVIFSGKNILSVSYNEVAAVFLTPTRYFSYEDKSFVSFMAHKLSFFYTLIIFIQLVFIQFLSNKAKFIAIFKNTRFPQMVFNWGLFLIGLSLGFFYFPQYFKWELFQTLAILNLLIAVLFAWLNSVVVNDVFDLDIDKMTNADRPLVKGIFNEKGYYEYGFVFLIIAFISSLVVGLKPFILIIVYALLTWVYSASPFRIKRFFPLSLIIASFSSLLFLFMGYVLVSEGQSLIVFPWRIAGFLFVVYCLVLSAKDFKDIESDGKFGVKTFPVLMGEEKARTVLAVAILIFYLLSVFVINESRLFVPALLFGGISFWKTINKKVITAELNWWLLGLVSLYGLFVLSFIFY